MNVTQRDKTLFDNIAKKYGIKDIVYSSKYPRKAQVISVCRKVFQERNNLNILEIGCGIGAPASYLNGYFDQYTGIDHSEKLIEQAREFNSDIENTQFVVSDIESFAKDNTREFDVILAVGVLHHIEDLSKNLPLIRNMLTESGFFIAIEPQAGNPFIGLMRQIRKKIDKSYSSDQRFFDSEELRAFLVESKFVDIEIRHINYLSKPFMEVVPPFHKLFIPLSVLCTKIDSLLNKSSCLIGKFSWDLVVYCQKNKDA
ncbi:MAG: class I SAM-dependent DNA methyltransferase [Sedimentisphaeraceae bacterium JB056]